MKKSAQIIAIAFMASSAWAAWDWFAALDKNQDGTVTEAEWIQWNQAEARKKGFEVNVEKQKASFSARDLNKDGSLSKEEFEASKPQKSN